MAVVDVAVPVAVAVAVAGGPYGTLSTASVNDTRGRPNDAAYCFPRHHPTQFVLAVIPRQTN